MERQTVWLNANGGPYGEGIIYEYNPATNTYTKKADFYSAALHGPRGALVLLNNKMYGASSEGGLYNSGVIFEFNPANNAVVKKYDLPQYAVHLSVFNNKIYGTTSMGGMYDQGTIFSYDPVTNTYTNLVHLTDDNNGLTGPFQPFNNKLYGVTHSGGEFGRGSIIEFNPANNVLTTRANILDLSAGWPEEGLTLLNNKFYGSTSYGGVEEEGVLFEYDPVQHTITKKMDFTKNTGYVVRAAFTTYNNKLYGTTVAAGNAYDGVLFEYDPLTNAYSKKVLFNSSMGTDPMVTMTVLNGKLYGLTNMGGVTERGVLFEYNPTNNGYSKKIELGTSNGASAYGKLAYYKGKLYGVTSDGGNNAKGVIFSYDLATHTYSVRYHLSLETGRTQGHGGMVLYNNKFYGVARNYLGNYGCLYEFDPQTDAYLVKHVFTGTDGEYPIGLPVVYNGKLYGTTMEGGGTDNGVLYEFDPATNNLTVKVSFGGNFGSDPLSGLVTYNGKIYGTASRGGIYDKGTLFEYIPAVNGFVVRHHFVAGGGHQPSTALVVHDNKLYGTTDIGDHEVNDPATFQGTLYEFDPSTNMVTTRHKFVYPAGSYPRNSPLSHNNKLYGLTAAGGPLHQGGIIYEYNPASNGWLQQATFLNNNGRYPEMSALIAVPALVAPGSAGACVNAGTATINTTNSTEWVPFTDEEGNAVMEINANGNVLGAVRVSFYSHDGATRKDAAGRFYLDRNISVSVDQQPVTPVSIRLYISKTEFEKLKSTPEAGILNLSDLTVFKNDDACSPAISKAADPLIATALEWGLDYVFTATVNSFSSFWFASKLHAALPVTIGYFNGEAKPTANWLYWKASCTENTEFIIERSTDGIHFKQIGVVLDCGHNMQFPDQQPVAGRAWYRLQMKESSGAVSYSSIIMLEPTPGNALQVQLAPNPVTGAQAMFRIYSPGDVTMPISIYDGMGRLVRSTRFTIQKGSQNKSLNVRQLPVGIYSAVYMDGGALKTIRFVKQ